jgi:hypothetical protein
MGEDDPMRLLRTVGDALSMASSAFDRRQMVRWAGVGATIAATAAAVVLASFVAVAIGLT